MMNIKKDYIKLNKKIYINQILLPYILYNNDKTIIYNMFMQN